MTYGTEVPGFCSECGQQTDTLPCPHCIASVTQPAPTDQYLARCRGCGQWKDKRVECIVCRPPGSCVECRHPVREHSSEPGIGCLHFNLLTVLPADPYDCPCTLPGTSQADQ